jgi:AcrR family transcriptional regulator
MPYPAKTTAQSIVAAAITQLETSGPAGISMRVLASALGITPRALYRYFPDRAALDAAIAADSFRELLAVLQHAADHADPEIAIRAAARAYLEFAAAHPARYNLIMTATHDPDKKSQAQEAVWQFVLAALARVTGRTHSEDAALALWAMLHGFTALERAGIMNGQAHSERGLAIFLAGLAASP